MEGYEAVSELVLDEETHQALQRVLERVRAEHQARLVFLAEACGRPLAVCGPEPLPDLEPLGSLVASLSSAAAQIESLLGESGGAVVFQKGERDVLHITRAADVALAVVFPPNPPTGLDRVRARLRHRRALAEIEGLLHKRRAGSRRSSPLAGATPQELDKLLDTGL
ncbi:MAG: hypothetical protein GXP50_05145 [Deltaproteobacteria bacterium]|nr:hypothetical protein [Deltaproteobacteria bacterium]